MLWMERASFQACRGEGVERKMLFLSSLVRMAVFPSDTLEPPMWHVSTHCCLDAIRGTALSDRKGSYAHLLTCCYCCWFFLKALWPRKEMDGMNDADCREHWASSVYLYLQEGKNEYRPMTPYSMVWVGKDHLEETINNPARKAFMPSVRNKRWGHIHIFRGLSKPCCV